MYGNRWAFTCAAALAWCAMAANLAVPWTVGGVLAAFMHDEPVIGPVAQLTALTLVSCASQAGCGRLLARAGERLVLDLRGRITHHVLRLPLPDARARGVGDISARITYDTLQVCTAVQSGLVHLPAAAFGVAAVLTAMACLDPQLTLLTVGSFVLAGGPLAGVLARTRVTAATQQQALACLLQRLHTCLEKLTTIKSYRYETTAAGTLEQAAAHLGTVSVAATRLHALVGPLVGLAQQLALVAVTVTAVHRIGSGTLSLTAFSTFFFLLLCLASPMTVVAIGAGHLRTGQAARARIESLLALPDESEVPSPSPAARRARLTTGAAVVFRHVTFTPSGAHPVLSDLSFTVPATGLTVLVGPSGVGKSTVLALITRLLRADQGEIHVLGEEVGSWRLSQLRRHVVHVEQGEALMEGTIEDNLRMGCGHGTSQAALWNALDEVGLTGTVERLPLGLDTPLGGGRLLSGGQCQRLSLARALLTDADLFLLDEPTSHLDTVNERHVLCALDRLAATRPVLMATHRPHLVPEAASTIVIPTLPHTTIGSPRHTLTGR
ncbi:ABC transporter ATP-binding protein [Streptomyces sp. NPDC058818]|uniref:ABC transporter ATP-binding protein n=1 Tax=Streptomyces sp. NPDC058818 TaxID=3346640 RepID=UPI0036C6BA8C